MATEAPGSVMAVSRRETHTQYLAWEFGWEGEARKYRNVVDVEFGFERGFGKQFTAERVKP